MVNLMLNDLVTWNLHFNDRFKISTMQKSSNPIYYIVVIIVRTWYIYILKFRFPIILRTNSRRLMACKSRI